MVPVSRARPHRAKRALLPLTSAALAASLLLTPAFATTAGAHSFDPDGEHEVIASGLDNPRGLGFDKKGRLYVAEAGTGGDDCFEVPPEPGGEPPEGEEPFIVCVGATGAITKVWPGGVEPVVEGLASNAAEQDEGNFAIGPHDVAFHGDKGYFVIGLFAPPEAREFPAIPDELAEQFAYLFKFDKDGDVRSLADIGAHEEEENPDGDILETNPYSVLPRGDHQLVVDASGNSLVRVDKGGDISTVAVFPIRPVEAPPFIPPEELPPDGMFPMHSVPTSVVKGPDGAYYVSELTGFPFPQGEARIYRVVPGEEPEVYADGFTMIIDIAFDHDGNLLVLEFFSGSLIDLFGLEEDPEALVNAAEGRSRLMKLYPNGAREPVAGGLTFPGGVAVADNGDIFVTNRTVLAGGGEVLRITPYGGIRACPDSPDAIDRDLWEAQGYNIIVGTEGDDELWGTTGKDLIFGLGGNDRIYGMAGDDIIVTGDGNNVVYAGRGNDIVCGGDGNDRIYGGPGDDLLLGGKGNDRVFGNEGNDVLWGEYGNDTLVGGPGHDVLHGGKGNDFLNGDDGNDVLHGGPGTNTLKGKAGDNIVKDDSKRH